MHHIVVKLRSFFKVRRPKCKCYLFLTRTEDHYDEPFYIPSKKKHRVKKSNSLTLKIHMIRLFVSTKLRSKENEIYLKYEF